MIRKTLLAMLGGVERERYDSAMKRGDFWRSAYDEELSAKCRALDACDRAEAEARDADEALRTTLEHGAVTDDILALATALGMREGKNTANGIAKHALEEYRRVVQERDFLALRAKSAEDDREVFRERLNELLRASASDCHGLVFQPIAMYAEGLISSGRLRECIGEWVLGKRQWTPDDFGETEWPHGEEPADVRRARDEWAKQCNYASEEVARWIKAWTEERERVEAVESERDALRADVERLTRERDEAWKANMARMGRIQWRDERDAAVARAEAAERALQDGLAESREARRRMSEELHGVEKRAEAAEARLAEVENGRAAGWSQLFDKLEKLGRLTGERSVIVETLAALDALAEATSPVAASERAAGQKAVERYRAQIRYANAPSWTDEEVLAENAMGAASRALDTAIVALERAYAESGNGATKASATADDSGCKEP